MVLLSYSPCFWGNKLKDTVFEFGSSSSSGVGDRVHTHRKQTEAEHKKYSILFYLYFLRSKTYRMKLTRSVASQTRRHSDVGTHPQQFPVFLLSHPASHVWPGLKETTKNNIPLFSIHLPLSMLSHFPTLFFTGHICINDKSKNGHFSSPRSVNLEKLTAFTLYIQKFSKLLSITHAVAYPFKKGTRTHSK